MSQDFVIQPSNIRSGYINIGRGDFDPNLSRIERFDSLFKFERQYINKPVVTEVGDRIFEYVWNDVWMDGLYNYRNFRKGGQSFNGFFIIRKEIITTVTQYYALQYIIDLEIINRDEN